MLVAPKTVVPWFCIQNDLIRVDIGRGAGNFNWSGFCAVKLQEDPSSRVIFNVCDLWEVVLVEPTGDPDTERYKVVTPQFVEPTIETLVAFGKSAAVLTWDDVLVDGEDSDPDLDRLKIEVTLELRDDEAFIRSRINVSWTQNRPSTAENPGRYAIWRVRFPIVDLTPIPSNTFQDEVPEGETEDVLFVPENHGVLVKAPTKTIADPVLGAWEPQVRSEMLRNVVRPGAIWRQSHPGLASTQVMGYYGEKSGRGLIVGCLDRLGRLKELTAVGHEDSVCMAVLQVPEWCYSLGNRPTGFTGALEGDSRDGRDALTSHSPQAGQDLPALDYEVPNTRDIEVDGHRTPSVTTANPGLMRLGRDQLGTSGTVTNTSLSLGYFSPYDVVIAPVKSFDKNGWAFLADAWRRMAERPDSAFPLQQMEDDEELPEAAKVDVLLEVDAVVHDGQESLIGLDEANFVAAYPDKNGVIADPQAVKNLISPIVIVPERASVNGIEIFGEGDLVFEADLLGPRGSPAGLQRQARPDSTRGYVRLFGKPNFYISPQQLLHNDAYLGFLSGGRVRFRTFLPASAGVQVGDYIKVISRWETLDPYIGRANTPVATDSELYPNSEGDQVRIVIEFGASANTLVVGRYVDGVLTPYAFTPNYANSAPDLQHEAEFIREELNIRMLFPVVTGSFVRLQVNVAGHIINDIFPPHSMGWAEVVEIDGVEYDFKRLIVVDGTGYVDFKHNGKPLTTFNGKSGRIRRRFAPIDLFIEQVVDGYHVLFDGVALNERTRTLALDEPWATDEAKLANGWLEFERPLVDEPAGEIHVKIYDGVPAANRLLDADIDIEGQGFRFVDTTITSLVAGGFGASVLPGDLLVITNSVVTENQDPFEIVEVLNETEMRVSRAFMAEMDPGGGFSYQVLRPARSFRDANFGGRSSQDLLSGPRRLLTGGQDRVQFLAVGFLFDPTTAPTAVFGVDSLNLLDLGANPFIPATSINVTTFKTSEWGTKKPSQEFPIVGYQDGTFALAKGWALEDPEFSVNFDDAGTQAFMKNVIQYRVVRDLREDAERSDFSGTKRSIDIWKSALEATAVMALIRGWQPKIRGFDRPDFLPARGKYTELLTALASAGHVAISGIDLHGLDLDDEDGLSDKFNLIALSYWNRFGRHQAQSPTGDEAVGENDQLVAPTTVFGRKFLLTKILEPLMASGVKSFLLDGMEKAFRDDYGSPHFYKPLDEETGTPTVFEVTEAGGGAMLAEGWKRLMAAVKTPTGVTQPMDWLVGEASFSSKDWAEIRRDLPTTQLPFPISGVHLVPLSGAFVLSDRTLMLPGVVFSDLRATIYGEEFSIQPGDWLQLLPSASGFFEVESVAQGLTLKSDIDLGSDEEFGIYLVRRLPSSRIAAAPFFRFAFGEYATVAADVTFLASDISWQEVVQQRGTGITEEQYQEAIVLAFGRALYRIASNVLLGMLPSVHVESEAARMVPPDRYGFSWTKNGTNSLVEQANVNFREANKPYPLIQVHLGYLRYMGQWMRAYPEFIRYGASAPPLVFSGATSLLLRATPVGSIGEERPAVVSGSFRNEDGDLLFLLSNWVASPFAEQGMETVEASFSCQEFGIETDQTWVLIETKLNGKNQVVSFIATGSVDQDERLTFSVSLRPLEAKGFILYRQNIIIRLDALGSEVDRVLIVPKGRSVAGALFAIEEDVGAGEDKYVVVIGAGAIQDGLEVQNIPGVTIEMQNSADENPTIGETT